MQVAAHLRAFSVNPNKLVRAAFRMSARKTDALKTVDFVKRPQETGEGLTLVVVPGLVSDSVS
jgi:hypothetical protein